MLIARLSVNNPEERTAFLINKINDSIKPPQPVTAENVHIRAMYIVNDLVNSHGGQFRREDLYKLCDLLVDTPVLVGHNRSNPPLARTFHAEPVEDGSILWIKSYFYWPRSADGVNDELAMKIDSGVLKECSISFIYTMPECTVCGQDMRSCPHDPTTGEGDSPHFIYNNITQVLETSLVYKGSVKGTYITDKLASEKSKGIIISHNGRTVEIPVPDGEHNPLGGAAVIQFDNESAVIPEIEFCPDRLAAAAAVRKGRVYLLAKSS